MSRQMKDSGVEWIGMIPEDWEIAPHKYIMYKKKDICPKYNGEDILSLTMNGVIVRNLENPTGKMPATFDGYQKVEAGNLLLCLFDIDVTPRCVGYVKNNGLTSPAYSQFVLLNGNNPRYYDYLLRMIDDKKCFLHLSKNLRSSLTEENFGIIKSVVPPLDKQQNIADFLDENIAEIESTIVATKNTIEDYKKYKQSVITEAVTKGLNPNVEMKDSGIEWIGQIPKHWHYQSLKSFTTMISKGTTPKNMSMVNDVNYEIRYIKSENIINNILSDKPEFYITKHTHLNELSRSQLKNGDILFVIAGASIGKVAIMKDELLPANTNQAVSFIRMKEKNSELIKYLWYYLQSNLVGTYIQLYSVQSAQPNISMENLGNIKITISNNINEQKQIVKYLNEKCAEIDNLISSKEVIIEELEAYKRSLIYEYVTGKKEVN